MMNVKLDYRVDLTLLEVSWLQDALSNQVKNFTKFAADARDQSDDDIYWQIQIKRITALKRKIERQTF
jgi:hypothetical protein